MIKLFSKPKSLKTVREREPYFTKGRRKLIYNFFLNWSKGGSREQLEVSTLPRDLVG